MWKALQGHTHPQSFSRTEPRFCSCHEFSTTSPICCTRGKLSLSPTFPLGESRIPRRALWVDALHRLTFCIWCTKESWTSLIFHAFFLLVGSSKQICGGAHSRSFAFSLSAYMYTQQGASYFLMNACVGEGVKKVTE